MLEVVGAGAAELGGQAGGTRPGDLLGVQPQAEPGGAGGGQDAAGLVDGEDPLVAEDVGPAGSGGRSRWKRRDDLVDVVVAVAPGGHDVRAEVGRLQPDRRAAGELVDQAQQPQLGVDREPVAAS